MPFEFDADVCRHCPFGICIEDRRNNPVRGRKTQFRMRQRVAMACTFESFIPGFSADPAIASMTFDEYLAKVEANFRAAGSVLFGSAFLVAGSAVGKVTGDVLEILDAAALWNAAAAWNLYMDMGTWPSLVLSAPHGAIVNPANKVAIIKLPRRYDATKLLSGAARARVAALEADLSKRDMELGLSAPDLVAVRMPMPVPPLWRVFSGTQVDLSERSQTLLEGAFSRVEGTLTSDQLLMAIAVKSSMRSDRLYQPLFEANVLKYLMNEVLGQKAFRFYAHAASTEGADVEGHYRAASLISLFQGNPERAIDGLIESAGPLQFAQHVLDMLPQLLQGAPGAAAMESGGAV